MTREDANSLSLEGHVKELRRRISVVVLFFVVVFVIVYYNSSLILQSLVGIGKDAGYELVYLAPQEVFIQQLRIAGTLTVVLSTPIAILEIVKFVSPVFEGERTARRIGIWCLTGMILFVIGAIFAGRILLPFTYRFLAGISADSGIAASVSIEKFVSLFTGTIGGIGVLFEMPLVCIMLVKSGAVTVDGLKKSRSVVIVGIAVASAIITPPDVVSQVIVALPMIALYQVSIWICRIIGGNKNER